jgi:hypothetical protein
MSNDDQLKSVSAATQKMASLLKLNYEFVVLKEKPPLTYVYYKHGDGEPIPIYCNKGEKADARHIYAVLRNMLFVLSFHPRHSTLRYMRKEIMQSLS